MLVYTLVGLMLNLIGFVIVELRPIDNLIVSSRSEVLEVLTKRLLLPGDELMITLHPLSALTLSRPSPSLSLSVLTLSQSLSPHPLSVLTLSRCNDRNVGSRRRPLWLPNPTRKPPWCGSEVTV